ncbi:Flp family type IVb pilin [Arthrobacter sp. SDTb3-6]|uniref:Flp family type IVb pilin n=1 Tax=Arthrobacter sp. SDTb3-6 TaxID=2713571 RepID=UPI00159E526B|nr:Flp family type IVb pilin [Arthrobacter sp. SDTb3-6]NVN00079.1 Flp family type IVb pilin [Arthrobacter sp. SDTb3-6]
MLPLFITLQSFLASTKRRLNREESGATAVEYGLLVGLIAVVIVAALLLLGPKLATLFTNVSNTIPAG